MNDNCVIGPLPIDDLRPEVERMGKSGWVLVSLIWSPEGFVAGLTRSIDLRNVRERGRIGNV